MYGLYFSCSLAQMSSLTAPGHYMQKKQPTFCLTSPFMFNGRKQESHTELIQHESA